jgi:radical SAM superfamily enzyme YgiQ (UPF0313 family)
MEGGMRVLLVQPDQNRTLGLQQLARVEPLGLEMLAGALRGAHEVALFDQRLDPDGLPGALADVRPELLGITSSFTIDWPRTLAIARAAKAADPRTFVVAGGHHVSLRPLDARDPAIDAIAVGEGEATLRELADVLAAGGDPRRVPGLVLNEADGQATTAPRPLLRDLDTLPMPDRTLTRAGRARYYAALAQPLASVESARGCPYRCSFCAVWQFYQKRVRYKSPARVVEELAQVAEPTVLFTDDNFLASPKRAAEIARLIRERGLRHAYGMQARSDAIVRYPELLAAWREIGLQSVFIGFEKPDQGALEGVNKHNSVANNEQALAILRGLGIEPVTSFIVDPDASREDFAALRAYVHRLKLQLPAFTILTPLPGTQLFGELQGQLTSEERALYDLSHAVLPTRLPPRRFYAEFARLWASAYPAWKVALVRLAFAWRARGRRPDEQEGWRIALAEIRRFANPRAYQVALAASTNTPTVAAQARTAA